MTSPDPMKVSGPGAYAERTDDKQPIRTPTGLPYGDAGQLTDLQRQAPLPATPPPPELSAPTQNPGQPVTAGAALGAGPGTEVLNPQAVGLPDTGGPVSQALSRVAAVDSSGIFAQLLTIAQQKGL
jgi:hypothetical protein